MSALADYDQANFQWGPWQRTVYRKGSGPGVIIMHEMPGLHPLVVRFADRVAERGMTVFLPSLFGQPERPISGGYAVKELLQGICIRREFSVWATDRSSPIVDWLRALARKVHADCGGAGVGAVGMCFTGGFALAMMTEPAVVAPVLSQPSLPLPFGPGAAKRRCVIDASAEEMSKARERMDSENLSMLGLRFHGDPFVPPERFAMLKNTFGDRFEAIELSPDDAAPDERMAPHSVLTVHLNDADPEGPTREVERRVIEFFATRVAAAVAAEQAPERD